MEETQDDSPMSLSMCLCRQHIQVMRRCQSSAVSEWRRYDIDVSSSCRASSGATTSSTIWRRASGGKRLTWHWAASQRLPIKNARLHSVRR